MRDRETLRALAKTIVFTVLVPGTVTVLMPYWLLSSAPPGAAASWAPWRFLGLVPMTAGALGALWSLGAFALIGQGTPAPIDPPRDLVAVGLYRFVRNPMYVAVLLVVFGEALLFSSSALAVYGLTLWAFFHLFVVFYEEPALTRRFGDSYRRYRAAVPRWLPRWPRQER